MRLRIGCDWFRFFSAFLSFGRARGLSAQHSWAWAWERIGDGHGIGEVLECAAIDHEWNTALNRRLEIAETLVHLQARLELLGIRKK